jgi:hypothetical protein
MTRNMEHVKQSACDSSCRGWCHRACMGGMSSGHNWVVRGHAVLYNCSVATTRTSAIIRVLQCSPLPSHAFSYRLSLRWTINLPWSPLYYKLRAPHIKKCVSIYTQSACKFFSLVAFCRLLSMAEWEKASTCYNTAYIWVTETRVDLQFSIVKVYCIAV